MNLFTAIPLLIGVIRDINKAMEDKVVTVQEVVDITNNTLLNTTGKTLRDIGFRIVKTQDDKTKIEAIF